MNSNTFRERLDGIIDAVGTSPNEGEELRFLAKSLRKLLYRADARRIFNEHGVHVAPANFYSPLPTFEELDGNFEYAEPQPYRDPRVFNDQRMLDILDELSQYAAEFNPPLDGNADDPKGFFWKNPAFSYSDAMAYYTMVRRVKPKHIVEIGSGFSTLVASQAIEQNGFGSISCVEPYPKPWLKNVAHVCDLIKEPVQTVDSVWFNSLLCDGDMLFIDSTHTVKAGSDCVHLYLRVLPRLEKLLTIHAHDIFLPEGYPKAWAVEKAIHWNEQYLLYAMLLCHPKWRVLYGSNYLKLNHPDPLIRMLDGKTEAGGASLWWEQFRA